MIADLVSLCQVCGAPASYINFGVRSCPSCKMFFKRNAECKEKRFQCDLDGCCEVTIYNRRTCSACRLAKCFASGMQTMLIRGSRLKKNKKKRSTVMTQLPTLSLLRADHSSLTADQWTLLSNLTHAYDEYGGLRIAELFLHNQRTLPIKLRFKLDSVGEMLVANMGQVQRILERNDNYHSLSAEDRSILLRRNVGQTSCLGATFAVYHSGLLSDPCFSQSAEVIFTAEVMATIIPLTHTFDPDVTFLKLLLSILAFSTAHSMTSIDRRTRTFHNVSAILRIQDAYVELAWKYMVYKYTHEQAVKRFCQLLRFLFNVNRTISQVNGVETYRQLIDTVVERTEQILSLKD